MLADFCFSDLLLYVPAKTGPVGGGRPGASGHRPDDVPDRLGRLVGERVGDRR